MNLKDVDLRDFFRLIHEISGLNVVVDPSVKGTLTIVLDDVPWDQALDIVLHNNDLDKQLDGNVLRIATKDTLRKEAEESRDLARAQAEAADVVTTTRRLSYAKATTIATTLKKFLSSRGDILADDRSNTLIIRDIPTTFPVIDNLLRQLDRQIAAGGNRGARRGCQPVLLARDRNRTGHLHAETGNSAVAGDNAVGYEPDHLHSRAARDRWVGKHRRNFGPDASFDESRDHGSDQRHQYHFPSANFALDYVIDAAESEASANCSRSRR